MLSLKNPVHFLATGFGSGLLKPAPGTWGSLAGLFLAIFLWKLTASSLFFILFTAICFVFGIWLCHQTSEALGVHDDGRIVWDEIVAILFIFCFLPAYNTFYYGLAFISFRIFDILKPFPIHYFDKHLENGFGIMFDDILAAIYALISLYFIHYFI